MPGIIKIHFESAKNGVTLKNLNVLCDINLILGFACFFALLNYVPTLKKIAKGRNVFKCVILWIASN
jgi:hypothetical protein